MNVNEIDIIINEFFIMQEYYNNLEDCPICFQKVGLRRGEILPCNHIFHNTCISRWFENNNTCPTCRTVVFEELQGEDNINLNINFHTLETRKTLYHFKLFLSLYFLLTFLKDILFIYYKL
jgi:hypothetical protein